MKDVLIDSMTILISAEVHLNHFDCMQGVIGISGVEVAKELTITQVATHDVSHSSANSDKTPDFKY